MRLRALILVLALGVFYLIFHDNPKPTGYGEAQVGGAFTLTDTKGHTTRDSDFRGRPMLVYMGFTHCPDICPTTLTTLSAALKILGSDANDVATIFITVDPTHDTPAVMGKYLESFDPHIIGLTGSEEAIKNVTKAYKVYAQKEVSAHADSYTIDHSGYIYLMDKNGKYVTHFAPNVKPETIAQAVRAKL